MIVRLGLAALVVSLALNFVFMAHHADWWILLSALVGWALADMVSGLIHMLMDYVPCPARLEFGRIYFEKNRTSEAYLRLKDQIMGRANGFYRIAYDFKTHHPHPEALGRRSFVQLTRATVLLGALPLSIALNVVAYSVPLPGWLMAMVMTLVIGGAFAQYFHSSLHRSDPSLMVDVMRFLGLLMSPESHDFHHRTLDRDFAFITGWSNVVLNPLFRALHKVGVLSDDALDPPKV